MAEQPRAGKSRFPDGGLPPPPLHLCWIYLAVLSIADAARTYIYDCIGPLARLLSLQLHFSNAEIGLLQACCSLPSIFMVLIGGVIIDRIGVKIASTIFASLCLMGAFITTLSPHLWVMATGRLVYGLGAGSLSVAVCTGIAKWFRGVNISFIFGLSLTISRLGSLLAQTSPAWARWAYSWWRTPLVLAVLAGVLCLLCAITCWSLESKASKNYCIGSSVRAGKVALKGMLTFSPSYWLVLLLSVAFYVGIFPFQTFAQKFFIETHHLTLQHASVLVGIPTTISLLASPLFGLAVDKIGRRSRFLILGLALLAPVYLLMGYGHLNLLIPVTLMGMAFALVPAVAYPAVMMIVPQENLGKAFGLMAMITGAGVSGFNLVIGLANDFSGASETNPAGYHLGMWLFSAAALLGLGMALLLWCRETGPDNHGLEVAHGLRPAGNRSGSS